MKAVAKPMLRAMASRQATKRTEIAAKRTYYNPARSVGFSTVQKLSSALNTKPANINTWLQK